MNLLEFITYCRLKDYVIEHEKFDDSNYRNHYRVRIELDNVCATILYSCHGTFVAGTIDYGVGNGYCDNPKLLQIVNAILHHEPA
jgi:hypothetical protein